MLGMAAAWRGQRLAGQHRRMLGGGLRDRNVLAVFQAML